MSLSPKRERTKSVVIDESSVDMKNAPKIQIETACDESHSLGDKLHIEEPPVFDLTDILKQKLKLNDQSEQDDF